MRVLGRVRLSVGTDESTSVARQRSHIEQWAALHEHDIVGWAIDEDVSGTVDPFKTAGLGPWLRPDRLDEWDVLVAWKLDRVARRVIPLNALFGFLQDHRKSLACTHQEIDLSSWVGRLVANVIAGVAEGELEAIRDRVSDSQRELRTVGRYRGGPVPYGYRKVRLATGWGLEIHPEHAETLRGLIDRYMTGESLYSIVRSLNADGVPSPKGGAWATSSLSAVFKSRALIGQSTHKGAVVLGEDGMPVQRAEPIIPADRYHELQERMSGARKGGGGAKSGQPRLLLDIARCGRCGAKRYHYTSRMRRGDKVYENEYWRCSGRSHPRPGQEKCTEPNAPARLVEQLAIDIVNEQIGDLPRTELVYFPPDDASDELARVEDVIRTVRREKDAGLYDGDEDEYLSRLARLISRRDELRQAPRRPARYERIETGGTWREALANSEDVRGVLLSTGLQMYIRDKGRVVYVRSDVDKLKEFAPGAFTVEGVTTYVSPDSELVPDARAAFEVLSGAK